MDWMKKVIDDSGAKIKSSQVFTTMFSKDYMENPRCLLELGMSMVLDKPICIIALNGQEVPENLKKVAITIQHVKANSDAEMKMAVRAIGKICDDLNASQD